jgi:hypothetical protein
MIQREDEIDCAILAHEQQSIIAFPNGVSLIPFCITSEDRDMVQALVTLHLCSRRLQYVVSDWLTCLLF